MLTIICITILVWWIKGKDIAPLLARVRNVDWQERLKGLSAKLRPYAAKAGRAAARPLLQFRYVMADANTPLLDKVLVYAAILYVISPVDLLPRALYKFLGILDDGLAVAYVLNKVKDRITPEVNAKVDRTLDDWFGTECDYEITF